ncbi:MAG: hypothetical protein A3D92_23205 [Bacteroidetes bacterium RIFCSPHIGHO2_02_FULL_44_7]|nr:MAG: hypothetical protein A3D92_23205 [Bacteroidetes bacterium RIFCSPHIGHO2_02_FULL_44_7]
MKILINILLGAVFGYLLIASEAFHWYRIQEMFHFQSFHMFGLLGSAIVTAAVGVWSLKVWKIKGPSGKPIKTVRKEVRPFGNLFGGLFFGIGWALTGACTAPLFILIGVHWEIGIAAVSGALAGVILYAQFKSYLPK